jgi:hypothetical protein
MTVGHELIKITDLRLFHNHMTIETVLDVFGGFHGETIKRLRNVIFEDFLETDHDGMIFTFIWAFDQPSDWDYIASITDMFKAKGADVYYVELVAPQEIRLERNATEHRLNHKPSKRDLEFSKNRLIEDNENYRCDSLDGEITFDNYIKIDNSNMSPEVTAKMIKDHFEL